MSVYSCHFNKINVIICSTERSTLCFNKNFSSFCFGSLCFCSFWFSDLTFTGMFSNAFNPSTGLGIKGETEKTLNKNVVFAENDKINKKKVNIAVYAFIPEEKGTFQVGVKVYDVNDNVIRDLHFDNVVLQQNHLTTYKGPLFTSGSTFEFSFDNNDFEKSDYDTTFGD